MTACSEMEDFDRDSLIVRELSRPWRGEAPQPHGSIYYFCLAMILSLILSYVAAGTIFLLSRSVFFA
jgi:hypothetical protein